MSLYPDLAALPSPGFKGEDSRTSSPLLPTTRRPLRDQLAPGSHSGELDKTPVRLYDLFDEPKGIKPPGLQINHAIPANPPRVYLDEKIRQTRSLTGSQVSSPSFLSKAKNSDTSISHPIPPDAAFIAGFIVKDLTDKYRVTEGTIWQALRQLQSLPRVEEHLRDVREQADALANELMQKLMTDNLLSP